LPQKSPKFARQKTFSVFKKEKKEWGISLRFENALDSFCFLKKYIKYRDGEN